MNEWTRCLQNAVKQTRDTNQQQITLGEIGPSASPPPWGITLLSNGSETGKGGISTLQERGHFYLALTVLSPAVIVQIREEGAMFHEGAKSSACDRGKYSASLLGV
jgi:hypothetical protein